MDKYLFFPHVKLSDRSKNFNKCLMEHEFLSPSHDVSTDIPFLCVVHEALNALNESLNWVLSESWALHKSEFITLIMDSPSCILFSSRWTGPWGQGHQRRTVSPRVFVFWASIWLFENFREAYSTNPYYLITFAKIVRVLHGILMFLHALLLSGQTPFQWDGTNANLWHLTTCC